MSSYGANIGDYNSVLEPDSSFFDDAFRLAEKVGGTLGLTDIGRLVIRLDDPAGPSAQEWAEALTEKDFPHCYVVPGTDSVLVFDL